MKATGIVRKVDELGRVVIPKELRRTYGINEGDAFEIFTTDQGIVLRKYAPGCTLCNSVDEPITMTVAGKPICTSCASDIKGGSTR